MQTDSQFYTDSQRSIAEKGLEKYVLDIELNGFTIVPPEVTGLNDEKIDHLVEVLMTKCEELVGCQFDVQNGPEKPLDFGKYRGTLERISGSSPSQFQLVEICKYDRAFRDLAVNPVSTVLMHHILGSNAKFSSHNCFIKWAGEGYGDSLGLHCDQPTWGRPLNANCNWALTDYTKDNGAFACVPGSHLWNSQPVAPQSARQAIPLECPRGSLIAFHGLLWHGAYPRTTPGLRVTVSNYFRHPVVQPQNDISHYFPQELAEDCDDPDTFKAFCGFGLPYRGQVLPVPKSGEA